MSVVGVVDLGGYLRAGDRAAWCAQQAARAATGRLDLDQAQSAGTAAVCGDAAVVTAQQMAVAAGYVELGPTRQFQRRDS
jgi:Flp pilus assembly protein TadG